MSLLDVLLFLLVTLTHSGDFCGQMTKKKINDYFIFFFFTDKLVQSKNKNKKKTGDNDFLV